MSADGSIPRTNEIARASFFNCWQKPPEKDRQRESADQTRSPLRRIVIILTLCHAIIRCQGQSWGTFWEIPRSTSTATCPALTATDSVPMACVPANTTGFIRGSTAVGGSSVPEHTVASLTAFAIARQEVKFADWLIVRTWATSNGYAFQNAGVQGSTGGGTDQQPVTTISWRDSIVWCNAASQKQGLTPVYYTDAGFTTPLKTSTAGGINATAGSEDNPYVNWSANGYRLPTEAEWEFAARYLSASSFLRGDAPSGWQDNNTGNGLVDNPEIDAVAWWTGNAGGGTNPVALKAANPLGIFDMSGNLWEHVWDWSGSYTTASPYTDADSRGPAAVATNRVFRGGSWSNGAANQGSASRNASVPSFTANDIGFRPARRP